MTETAYSEATPDKVLVRAAQAGAESSEEVRRAVCLLLARYRARVYAWCYRRLGDRERALDAAQEVLLSAYRRLDSYEGRSEFSSWLFVIARNRCLSELRRPQLLRDTEQVPDDLEAPLGDPASLYLERQSEEALLDLIRTHLEPLEQRVLWMRCFERIPIDRITRTLDIQEASGARGVLQRARRKLRAVLERRGYPVETQS